MLQVSDKDDAARAFNNQRSCCTSYPAQVQQGLIWVWPENSPSASLESAVKEPALCPEYEANKDGEPVHLLLSALLVSKVLL